MWKLTGLFNLLFLFMAVVFGSSLTESISLQVKVIGKILEEKPRVLPPERLSLGDDILFLDLSHKLLEPPKYIEKAYIDVPGKGQGCGEPKDRRFYRAGVKLYLENRLREAESRFLDLLALQNSAFIPQAQYFLGLIYAEKGEEKRALSFFESSCSASHPYRQASCEALYALTFRIEGKPLQTDTPELWKRVYEIHSRQGVMVPPSCTNSVFQNYCAYVVDFIQGKLNNDYRESTSARKALLLIREGNYEEAHTLLRPLSRPLSKYRDVALYYLGVIALLQDKEEEAYRFASLLEMENEELAKHLHILLSSREELFSSIAFRVTGSKEALRNSGILYYNRGLYELAYIRFQEAGDYLLTAYSAIRAGNYGKAYEALKRIKERKKEHYLWMLETLYWLGMDEEMEALLEEVKPLYPELYMEYAGWLYFKREEWLKAYEHFRDPYHKALALYNAGNYRGVLELLKEEGSLKARLLKAKSAISLGDGKLAREFLHGDTPQELYLTGMSYFIEGKYENAVEYFKRVDEETLKPRAILRIADSYYNLGLYSRARELYREILRLYPDSPESVEATLALAQIELQNPSSDIKVLIKDFAKRFPDSPILPELRYQLASIYLKEGQKEKAREILTELLDNESLKPKVLLKLAELEEDPAKKEQLLKEVIEVGGKEEKERATGMLMSLYVEKKEFEKLADFLVKGDYDDRKKALEIYLSENLKKAVSLFDNLIKENPGDEELKSVALTLYSKTRKKKYLLIAKESQNQRLRARALYLLGLAEKKRDKKKALEYFIEVVLTAKGVQPYYNRSIVEASFILESLKARRDASCLLEKLEPRFLSKKDRERVKILRKKLPPCEVKR